VRSLAASVRNHDVALPGITADGMEADLSLAEKLKSVRDAAESLYQFVDDTILEASSECWYAATAYYTMMSRMVSSYPDVKPVVAQVSSLFATGRRKQAGSAPQPSPK
jgi:hypothetical protein